MAFFQCNENDIYLNSLMNEIELLMKEITESQFIGMCQGTCFHKDTIIKSPILITNGLEGNYISIGKNFVDANKVETGVWIASNMKYGTNPINVTTGLVQIVPGERYTLSSAKHNFTKLHLLEFDSDLKCKSLTTLADVINRKIDSYYIAINLFIEDESITDYDYCLAIGEDASYQSYEYDAKYVLSTNEYPIILNGFDTITTIFSPCNVNYYYALSDEGVKLITSLQKLIDMKDQIPILNEEVSDIKNELS